MKNSNSALIRPFQGSDPIRRALVKGENVHHDVTTTMFSAFKVRKMWKLTNVGATTHSMNFILFYLASVVKLMFTIAQHVFINMCNTSMTVKSMQAA